MATVDDAQEKELRLRVGDLASRAFEEQTIVLDLRSSRYMSTNAAGTVLWHRLERGATRPELIGALCDAFGIDAETASRDVDVFLDDCGKRGLLDAFES